jgi:hypothetical protein
MAYAKNCLPLLLGTVLLGAGMATAQVRPLPPSPIGPQIKAPSIAPLEIVEAPSGEVFGSYIFGYSHERSDRLMVRTRGGEGTVTVRVEVEGRTGAGYLMDPPRTPLLPDMTLATPKATPLTLVNQAAPVSKVIGISGFGEVRGDVPRRQKVTVIARDSTGREVRREFQIRYTLAMGAPSLTDDFIQSSSRATELVPSHFTPAVAETLYDPDVPLAAFQRVTLFKRFGLNFSLADPDSEIICLYGTFRYACDYESMVETPREGLAETLVIKVPDLGREKRVGIILKNPYGESAPLMVDIDTRIKTVLRRSRGFNGPTAGKQPGSAAPFYNGSPIGDNGTNRTCDRPYLVWVDAKTDGKMFHDPKGLPITLKFVGDASVRIVSVPRGQAITNNVAASWAKIEFDVPLGVLQDYLYSVELTYDTRMGECPAKRR